jgi:hypothetical protein
MLKTRRKTVVQNIEQNGEQTEQPTLSLKERLAQRRKANRIRQELISFTIFTVFFSALVGFLVGLMIDPVAGAAATMGLLYTALSFKYPRYALWAFLIYLPFAGTITYMIGNSPLLQLAKDGFYIPALLGVIQYCRRERLPIFVSRPLVVPLGILVTFSLLTFIFANGAEQLTPGHEGQPLAMGVLGLKVFLGYIPLIVCGYYLIRNRDDFLFLTRLIVILILVACGLAFLQYVLLKIGYCPGTRGAEGEDLFKASLEARCLVGGALLYSPDHGQIRLPGTFVAPWQWGWFLISGAFLAFGSAFNDPKPHWRTLGLLSLASVFVMSVLSGQRIALALVPLSFIGLLFLTGQIIQIKRFLPSAVGLGIVLGIAVFKNPETLQQRIESLQGRWEASPPHDFILKQFDTVLRSTDSWFGNGLGTATNSARVFGDTRLVEAYYPKLIYEVGLLGTLAFLIFVTVLTYVTFKAYRNLRDPILRNYAAAFWIYILFISYNTYYYPLDVDPAAVYYWFIAGVLLKLPVIVRQERKEALEAESGKNRPKRTRLKRAGFA